MGALGRRGEGALDRFAGDFAFVLWDAREQSLTLVRDPLGARPLHYHRDRNFLAVASMPKGLHVLPEVPRAPDEERIADYLLLLPEWGSQSFFKDVERVEGGHIVKVTREAMTKRRYWQPQRKTVKLNSTAEYAEGMLHHLDQAVRSQLRGAGNAVATHLSSGFDSSAVTSSAAIEMARRGGKVVGFTAVPREGYDGGAPPRRHGDEGPIAALTAARYPNIEHVLIRTGGRSPLDGLDRNVFLFDQPILNLCNMTWAAAINDAARERKLRVLLTGQMGNMTISYDGITLLPQLIRSGRLIRWAREAIALSRKRYLRPLGILSNSFGPYIPVWLWDWINKTMQDRDTGFEAYSAIRPDLLAQKGLAARAAERATDLSYRPRNDGFESRLWVLRRVDLGNLHKGQLAGWDVDVRDPTRDRRLIEYCLSLPEEECLVNGTTRALSRHAFANRLPRDVIEARTKGYQAVDWHEGLSAACEQLRDELERLDACAPAAAVIDVPRLRNLVENWPDGDWHRDRVMRPYRLALLRGISTGHFVRRAGGSNA